MDTLIQTKQGSAMLSEIIDDQQQMEDVALTKDVFWEAFRTRVNTIGAQEALMEVLRSERSAS